MMKIKNPTFTKRYLYREKLKKTNPIHVSYKILKKKIMGGISYISLTRLNIRYT